MDCAQTADASTVIGVAVGVAVTGSLIALPSLLHPGTDTTTSSVEEPPSTTVGEIGAIDDLLETQETPSTVTVEPSVTTGGIDLATAPFMEVLQYASIHLLETPNRPPPHSIAGLGTLIDILIDRMQRMPGPRWIERQWRGAEFSLRWVSTHPERVVAVELDKFGTDSQRKLGPDAFLSDGSLIEFKSLKERGILRLSKDKDFINSIISTRRNYKTQPIQVIFDSRKETIKSKKEWDEAKWTEVEEKLERELIESLKKKGISETDIGRITFTHWP
jgi:hypothetical protein